MGLQAGLRLCDQSFHLLKRRCEPKIVFSKSEIRSGVLNETAGVNFAQPRWVRAAAMILSGSTMHVVRPDILWFYDCRSGAISGDATF
jgi:hypothetical protein